MRSVTPVDVSRMYYDVMKNELATAPVAVKRKVQADTTAKTSPLTVGELMRKLVLLMEKGVISVNDEVFVMDETKFQSWSAAAHNVAKVGGKVIVQGDVE